MTSRSSNVEVQTSSSAGHPSKFFNRNYVLIWQGQLVSRLGTQASSMVMLLWIKQATDSASLMGLMAILTNVPAILMGIVGGTVADRYSRRNIIAMCDALSGLALLALAVLFTLYGHQPGPMTGIIIGITVFVAVADAFSSPAIVASVPDLVPKGEITRANSLGQLSAQVAAFLGQGLGGVFFRVLGAQLMAVANAITFLWAAVTESFAAIPQTIASSPPSWRQKWANFRNDTIEGFRYILGVEGLAYLIAGSAVSSFLSASILFLIPFYVTDVLQVKEDWVGFLSAAYGVGALIGNVAAGGIRLTPGTRRTAVIAVMLVEASMYGVLGLTTLPPAALGVAFVAGAMGGFVLVQVMTILQITTARDRRGRLFAVTGTISASFAPLGIGVGAIVFDRIGHNLPAMYVGCSALMVMLVLVMASRRSFREYLASEKEA